jgi:hypothetical protein
MSRSIFDPTGPNTEHSGSTFTPPDAGQISQLPDEFTDPPAASTSGTVAFQGTTEKRAIDVAIENNGKLLVVKMTGRLHKDDYRHFVPVVENAVRQHGKIRMLVQMHDFHGWDATALWEDVKFDAKHFNHIERLAIVGETKWEKWMAIFCKPFTTATIRYFPSAQMADARAWIAAK